MSGEIDAEGDATTDTYTADRFVPERNGTSMVSAYSVIEENRHQSNQSPELIKGTPVFP
jgi:hypothetical protein